MPAKGKPDHLFSTPCKKRFFKMKKIAAFGGIFVLLLSALSSLSAQDVKERSEKLDSIVVEAYRAGKNTPVSHSELSYDQIRKSSPVNSVPMALGMLPSVVFSTEGGNGLGYSSLRIRGSEGSRINVTLNGIALNDSESQELFWVNIPSFTSILEDVQIQRGVGTSTNGPGAFGASLNMRTLLSSSDAYASADLGLASYNSYMTTFGAGTGILDKGLTFDIRYSRNQGDGYIDRAHTKLSSLFVTGGLVKEKMSLRLNYIMGDQISGITWMGISREQMESDRRYNPAGVWYDQAGNERFYDNETDNYTQHHIQLIYNRLFADKFKWSATLHYTKGDGYYENFKHDKKFSSYGLENQIVEESIHSRSDFVIRQNMDNNFWAFNTNLQFKNERLDLKGGLSYSAYDGDHFGNVIWSMYNNNIPTNYKWYLNNGFKSDLSLFVRGEYEIRKGIYTYADIQFRRVGYRMKGEDKDFAELKFNQDYNFFNPKIGFSVNRSASSTFYASLSVGQREPGRSDIKESVKAQKADELKSEKLIDIESGYRFSGREITFEAGIYLMEYKNQLVPTGKLSETGYVIKENVDRSFRRGVELSASWEPIKSLAVDGNLTLSSNKIIGYTSWTDQYDNPLEWNPLPQKSTSYEKTDIAFSPGVTGMIRATMNLPLNLQFSLNGKYVGKQYYDNTSDESRSIPSYFLAGLNLSREFKIKGTGTLGLFFYIDNLFDRKYFSNAWIYTAGFTDGSPLYIEEGLYPQAERNYTLRFSLSF